ncbi:hypothetical protein FOCC_FOCC003296 [Frankliniella occidentalis]|uniref:Leucine carboxyl methyltransferase 1 n=1 Tax=Frankliniella occidentalis TaxID=133901 RepID=A0A6J1S330_FRAOC|nr:leucine carboxyl methyltransferase 1 [Frankliniella occidentalis]KAE8749828.1 hypothetical protein FOCC_FOCC003296 [Frankliniella occidentalis]
MSRVPNDEAVQLTNDDATECKQSAVQLGYWQDPYLFYFARSAERKPPEINRGYFARKRGIELLVEKFLKLTNSNCQIVNLGAGFDTLYWRLLDAGKAVTKLIDLDFPSVTARKCHYIKRNKPLQDKLNLGEGKAFSGATELHAGNYHIVGVDLRQRSEFVAALEQCEIDFSLPTLFLAECVLVYIDSSSVDEVLTWIAVNFESVAFINYEQINMNDRFGEVMKQNLRLRQCSLSGVSACQNLDSQRRRFTDNNWEGTQAWDMVEVYDNIPGIERQRVEKIEFLDEQELLIQLFQHYCICVGWKGAKLSQVNFDF